MSTALRSAGYNVELALERLLGGDDASGGTSSASMSTFANNTGASVKKRKNETPAKSIKRTKSSPKTPATPHHSTAAASRLLLCKRWTVSCSKTIRGRISYGEKCNFDENYKSATASATTSAQKADPMVRFRTRYAEGTLNRYLCEILGPLLRLPATNISYNAHAAAGSSAKEATVPMIHLEAEALMEDNSLIIGSDIPINLKIYLNDRLDSLICSNKMSESRNRVNSLVGRIPLEKARGMKLPRLRLGCCSGQRREKRLIMVLRRRGCKLLTYLR